MRRGIVLGTLIAVAALSPTAAESQRPQPEPKVLHMRTLNVRDTLYLLTGGGGSTLVLVDEYGGGVVLVDTKLAGWGQPLLDAIRAVTDMPVTTIINTHAHRDHTGSNSEFPTAVHIVAHENTKATMAQMDAFKGRNAKFLPNKTFTNKVSLLDGVNRIDVYYFGPGHTDGDAVVVFPAKGVAYLGDLFPSKAAPFIDTRNGGSGVAYPETLAKAVAEITGVDRVITGHGTPIRGTETLPDTVTTVGRRPPHEVMRWTDLQEYAEFNRDFLAAVQAAKQAGKTVDEAVADLQLPEKYTAYGMEHAKANVRAIYDELKQ